MNISRNGVLPALTTSLVKELFARRTPTTVFFFQAEDGIRDVERSRGLGDVYKRQTQHDGKPPAADGFHFLGATSKWPYAKHISSA